jgi:Uncharacterized protein involved in tellurite resistance
MSDIKDFELEIAPSLTLGLEEEIKEAELPAEVKAETKKLLEESSLTKEDLKMVDEFADKIDIKQSNVIIQYGSSAQKKIADFSETALGNVRTKDLGEVGNLLTGVVTELKNFEGEEEKGFLGFFKKTANKLEVMKARYDKAEVTINKVVSELEKHQIQLLKDIAMLDKMYDMNKVYFKELTMYILAGKKKLEEVKAKDFPTLVAKAEATGLPEDAQEARDFGDLINRFEKKVHDLELTRMVSIQMAPQIRLVQGNDTLMTEKIQTTLVNTIPLWKSQMVLALGVSHSQQAAAAQREVTNMTNELLKKNAETLKIATVEVAKESERGIVDIETLKVTNDSLISTLDEVLKIQDEGRERRKQAEGELGRLEVELRQKLLQVRR